uniref:Uncharacterized protein n=1 Tax=viral metagenome TaxID=1070528 RepID=A0A6C0HQC9_9ZZZZ
MDRRQFLINVLLACIGLALIGYLHYKISKLYNYVDKNNKIVFSLMTDMREEVKRHFNGEPLSNLASIEAVNSAERYTSTDKNSHKIELSDDSDSEGDDTDDDEIEDESIEDCNIIDLKEEGRGENKESIKIINLMKGIAIENSLIRNVELDVENLILYRHSSFGKSGDNIKIDDISVVEEILDIRPELTSANRSEIVEVTDEEVDLEEVKDVLEERNELGSTVEKNTQDFSQLKVEDLRKIVHTKTGEKKEVIKKMKKTELVDLLSK